MSEARATAIGGTAVILWGALALFTTWTSGIPPFQLVGLTFTIAFLLMAGKWLLRGEPVSAHLRHPPAVWILGIGGLFGYHFFYFTALKNAPPVHASLIAYLWPLLIVVFSALLPGERLRWYHLAGALMGLIGCFLLVTEGGSVSFRSEFALGYLAASACALTWSGYSVVSRRFGAVPTDTVGWFCAGSAALGFLCHLLFERWVVPDGLAHWAGILLLGLGPVGVAFFTWDVGVKRGNIKVLGAMAYGAPLISAILLVLFTEAKADWVLGAACLLIVGGALLAAKEWLRRA